MWLHAKSHNPPSTMINGHIDYSMNIKLLFVIMYMLYRHINVNVCFSQTIMLLQTKPSMWELLCIKGLCYNGYHPFVSVCCCLHCDELFILKWWMYMDQSERSITFWNFAYRCTVYIDELNRCMSWNEYIFYVIPYIIYSNMVTVLIMLGWKNSYFVDWFI